MKTLLLLAVLIVGCLCVGCRTLRERTTLLPTGQDEYMQTQIDGREAPVRTLVTVSF